MNRVGTFISILFLGLTARAQSPFRLEPTRDWLLLSGGCALTVGGLIAYHNVAPLTLDEINALDRDDVNRFDRDAIRPFRQGLASDIATGVSVALPLTLLADRRIRQDWRVVGVMWGEALLLESGINAVVKSLTGRIRPYAYDPDTPRDRKTTAEARVSFYSGHTGTAAAMSFLTARLYSALFPDSRARTLVWCAAAAYPALIGVHRIRSGQHYPSDIIVGYMTGATVGYFIPALHKSGTAARISVEPVRFDGASGLRLAWRF